MSITTQEQTPENGSPEGSCSPECFFGGATDEFLIEHVYGTKASQEISSHQAAFGRVQVPWWWCRDKQGVPTTIGLSLVASFKSQEQWQAGFQ